MTEPMSPEYLAIASAGTVGLCLIAAGVLVSKINHEKRGPIVVERMGFSIGLAGMALTGICLLGGVAL